MDIITFYNGLSSFLAQHISKHNGIIIGGDMNAQRGKRINFAYITSQIEMANN